MNRKARREVAHLVASEMNRTDENIPHPTRDDYLTDVIRCLSDQIGRQANDQRELRALSLAADVADEVAPRDPVAMFAWHRALIESLNEQGYYLEREEATCPCCGEDHLNTMRIRAEAAAANAAHILDGAR